MIHLRSLILHEPPEEVVSTFPFSVPSVRTLVGRELVFDAEVTFLLARMARANRRFSKH